MDFALAPLILGKWCQDFKNRTVMYYLRVELFNNTKMYRFEHKMNEFIWILCVLVTFPTEILYIHIYRCRFRCLLVGDSRDIVTLEWSITYVYKPNTLQYDFEVVCTF